MSDRDRKELAWMSAPNPALLDGLISSGLVSHDFKNVVFHDYNSTNIKIPTTEHKKPLHASKSTIKRPTTSISKRGDEKNKTRSISQLPQATNMPATTRNFTVPDVAPSSRPTTGLGLPRSPVEIRDDKLPQITELLDTKRKYYTAEDVKKLENLFAKNTTNDDLKFDLTPDIQTEAFHNNINEVFVMWNKVNAQIRTHSEEHAKFLAKLKNFLQIRIEKIPEIIKTYVERINDGVDRETKLNEEIEMLNSQIEEANQVQEELSEETSNLMALNEELQLQISDMITEKGDMEIDAETQKSEINTLQLKLQRNDEQKSVIQNELSSLRAEFDDQARHLKDLENKLKDYEQVGVGFQPMYIKATEENEALKKKIEELNNEIEELRKQPDYQDFNTITDFEFPAPTETRRKKERRGTRSKRKDDYINQSDSTGSFTRFSRSGLYNEISENPSNSSFIFDPEPPLPLAPPNTPETLPHKENKQPESQIEIEKQEKEEEKIDNESSHSNNSEKNSKIASTGQIPQITANTSGQLTTKPDLTEKLPNDYNLDHNKSLDPETITNYVFRLLPLPLGSSLLSSPSLTLQNLGKSREENVKPYFWVLKHIINFYQSMVGVDNTDLLSKDCITLAQDQIIADNGIEAVAIRMFKDLMASTQFYKHSSDAVTFYLRFILAELNVVDLKFFKMLFNLCFEFLYPPMSDIIGNPDIKEFDYQFLIHISLCRRIFSIFYPHIHSEVLSDEYLRQETKSTPHPDLVSFWTFALKMITYFRETHTRFHKQVSGLLEIVGWSPMKQMTERLFEQFFIMINPYLTEDELKKMWKRFSLDNDTDTSAITAATFIRFCSDFPDISKQILLLPYNEKFNGMLSSLSDPLAALVAFIRARFTTFVRTVRAEVNAEVQKVLDKPLLAIRNSILRVDISSAVGCYRRFLQAADMKLIEERPYFSISPTATIEECKALKLMLMERENLVATMMGDLIDQESLQEPEKEVNPEDAKTVKSEEEEDHEKVTVN